MTNTNELKVVSLNVGQPRAVPWKDRTVTTGIFKEPVSQPVFARRLNLDGDRQADLTVHGGAEKAIYAYPAEHYPKWRQELPGMAIPYAMFGENLTTEGLREETVFIGDHFQVGEAVLVATQPRQPCYKLGIRFDRADILKRVVLTGRSGFYFKVVQEGMIKAGDRIERLNSTQESLSIATIRDLLYDRRPNPKILKQAVELPHLAEVLRDYFLQQLN